MFDRQAVLLVHVLWSVSVRDSSRLCVVRG